MSSQLLEALRRRVQMMVARCVVAGVNDMLRQQTVQIRLLADEAKGGVEHFQPYGFTSVPLPGAEGIALFLGGGRDHGVVIVVGDRRYRLKGLQDGEVALYTDEDQTGPGHHLVLKRGNRIEIRSKDVAVFAEDKLTLDCGGNGEVWTPGRRTSYVAGAATVTTAIAPPEIPGG